MNDDRRTTRSQSKKNSEAFTIGDSPIDPFSARKSAPRTPVAGTSSLIRPNYIQDATIPSAPSLNLLNTQSTSGEQASALFTESINSTSTTVKSLYPDLSTVSNTLINLEKNSTLAGNNLNAPEEVESDQRDEEIKPSSTWNSFTFAFNENNELSDSQNLESLGLNLQKPFIDFSSVKIRNTSTPIKSGAKNQQPPNPNGSQASEMPDETQKVPMKVALKVVPDFNGKNIPLSLFIEGCEEAKEMVEGTDEKCLVKFLRTKILDEARQAIAGQTFDTVGSLLNFLKKIYRPNKTEQQLLGELGNEFQRENESVITFANKIRDIGLRIAELNKSDAGVVEEAKKKQIEDTVIECFKNGLKPEIEQRIVSSNSMTTIVQQAVSIEQNLNRRNALRRQESNVAKPKRVFACAICKESDHETEECRRKMRERCDFCRRFGHVQEDCIYKGKLSTEKHMSCQICNKKGHVAAQCRSQNICQLCNKPGHIAAQCLTAISNQRSAPTCQLCNKKGHVANKCYKLGNNFADQIEARAKLQCERCNKNGHTAATCMVKLPGTDELVCNYCKNKGHLIQDCRKRQYHNSQQTKNVQSLSRPSATREMSDSHARSQEDQSFDNMLSELVPKI